MFKINFASPKPSVLKQNFVSTASKDIQVPVAKVMNSRVAFMGGMVDRVSSAKSGCSSCGGR